MSEQVSDIELARVVGVVIEKPRGPIEFIDGRVRIGSVIVADDGTVFAVPRIRTDATDIADVVSKAAEVAIMGRRGPHWRYHPRIGGWVACVVVRHHAGLAAQQATETGRAQR